MDVLRTQRREVFFSNLLLLGFNVKKMTRLYKIPFNKDMFILPNKKGFEIVTHFLFTKLDCVSSASFTIVWPITEPSQEREFRKTCFSLLMKITQGDTVGIRFPRIVASIFQSPGGERFYELYYAFSTYVIFKSCENDKICLPLRRPILTSDSYNDAKENLKISTISTNYEFIKIQKRRQICEKLWQKAAEDLTNVYRKVKQDVLDLQKAIKTESTVSQLLIGSQFADYQQELETELKELHHLDDKLKGLLSKDENLWPVIEAELASENVQKVILDGRSYSCTLPESIIVKFKQDLQGSLPVFENGKLAVKRFLDVFYVCLKNYQETFQEESLPCLVDLKPMLAENCQKLESCLVRLKNLSQTMCTILPDQVESIRELESGTSSQIFQKKDQPFKFAPKTPPLDFSMLNMENDINIFPLSSSPPKDFEKLSYSKELGEIAEQIPQTNAVLEELNPPTSQLTLPTVLKDGCFSPIGVSQSVLSSAIVDPSCEDCLPEVRRDYNVQSCIEQLEKFLSSSDRASEEQDIAKVENLTIVSSKEELDSVFKEQPPKLYFDNEFLTTDEDDVELLFDMEIPFAPNF